jgi:HD superfamily phosphodiesterase
MDDERGYIETLFPRINNIKDKDLRNKVINIWLKAWKMSDYKRIEDHSSWPPAREKLQLSNVEHTNQVVECAIAVANVIGQTQKIKIDLDTLIAAAILHDVDKIILFHESTSKLTPFGKLLTHTHLANFLALEERLPFEVVHAISAHSQTFSRESPKTPEALIISKLDPLMMFSWIMSKKIEVSFKIDSD